MARLAIALALVVPFLAVPAQAAPPVVVADDTRELTRRQFTLDGKALPQAKPHVSRRAAQAGTTPAVGTVRQWLGLDDEDGRFYQKNYRLRAVGEHIEVWVADDLAFPAGDCRTDAVEVTDAQVTNLVREFDANIYPRQTAAFSTPPNRDGTDPVLDGDFTGGGEKTVTLVDNVRDDNFNDFPEAATYIAGFFSPQLNELFDRNVMTIDAYDWKHRSGAQPPNEPTGDLCTSRPARPHMYEGTFAHEWQHLLQYYADPDEESWVNEGLSDYAQTLVGYVDPSRSVYHAGNDSHLTCYQGFGIVKTPYNTNPRDCGGPQNSLNLWDEGAPAEVLADYGIAYQFMLYLKDRFGPGVLSRLHRDGTRQGLDGVAAAVPDRLYDVIHDFQIMTLADKLGGEGPYASASLRSTVNLDNPAAYDRPGAAPNGADYLRLRGDLRSVEFAGAATLPPTPLAWTVAEGALFSGNRSNTDEAAVVVVTVPADDPTLRIRTKYGAELDYDFGYVTVSVDGGHTYTAIAGDSTVKGPLGPAINGSTGGDFVPRRYDLSAYAGEKILLGFRYVSDGAVDQGGWYVDDIAVGATAIGSSLRVFRSTTQIVPTAVHNWHVRLVGVRGSSVRVVPVRQFGKLRGYHKVVAVVAYDEPTEQFPRYAPYKLTVNGVRQPG